ncbi:4207_t:CDS:2, partial [Acaulospora morrowiae]
ILEIFHQVLKDFRKNLSLRDADQEKDLNRHAGSRLLSLLNDQLVVKKMTLQMNSDCCYRIPVSILSIFTDIKKLEKSVVFLERDDGFADTIGCLSQEINFNMSYVISLLNHKYQQINRKVLNILHLAVESGKNIGVIIESLSGILNYTQRIKTSPERDRLRKLLKPDINYTEFIFHEYYRDSCGLEFSLSLEAIKKLTNIYLTSFISLADILILNEATEYSISPEKIGHVTHETMSLCKGE